MSYEQYLFYTAQLSQMFGISSLPPLQSLRLGSSRTSNNLDKFASNDGLTGTVVQNLELVDHVASVLGGVVHGVLARGLLAGVTLSKSLFAVSSTFAQKRSICIPRRASWPERIRGGWGVPRPRSRKRSSWLKFILDHKCDWRIDYNIPDWVIASSE